jgi:LPXTG-site transpeptidase (sortase) family protein
LRIHAQAACALVATALLVACAAPIRPGAVPDKAASPTTNASRAIPDKPTPSTTNASRATPDKPATSTTAGTGNRASIRPLRLRIPSIGVDTRLETLGVTPLGRLQPPVDPQRAGWFPGSAVPGDLGPAVVAGHRDSTVGPAVFWHLTDLSLGDAVIVTRSDGVTVRFEVAQIRRVPRASFPTQQVYGATPDSMLRLITCGGLYDHVHGRYLDNVLVVALAV